MSNCYRLGRWRGFTLVEMAIAMGISAVVIMGGMSLLIGQQQAFQMGNSDRALQEAGRIALSSLTSNLRLAGFGIDPALSFDFGVQANVPMSQAPSGTVAATTAFQCATNVTCRDKTDKPDEVVFLNRDPAFVYPLATAYSSNKLTVTGPLRTPLYAGQILQVICFTDTMYWAYVTVASDVAASSAAQVAIAITSASGTDFPLQNGILSDPCFANAAPQGSDPTTLGNAAKVFKVDRYRYFIQSYDDAGNVKAWGSDGARPYLMLDRGLSNSPEVVAPDVEDLQLSYLFPASAAALQLIGATTATAIAASNQGIDLAPASGMPQFGDASNDPSRSNQHPGNIRAVRVAVVVRTAEYDAPLDSDADRLIPAAGNRPDVTGPAGYRRLLIQTTVPVRNVDSRSPYYPSYSQTTDHLNVGGG